MTNPLDGIDDLLTEYAFAVSEHHEMRLRGHHAIASRKQGEAKALRNQIRAKVAQANVIMNGIVVDAGAKRFQELLEAEARLSALEDAGVDNWDGYSVAMESLREKE